MKFLTAFRAIAFLLTVTQLAYPVAAQDNKLAPPTRLWAAQTDPKTITLVWQGAAGAVEYRLFGPKSKKGEAGVAIQQLATLGRNAVRYVALVVSPGIAHQFSIRAVGEKGQVSDQVKFNPVIPQGKQATPATASPPSSVTAKDIGSGKITIDWSPVPGATGYFLGRSVAPGGFNTLCALCPTKTSYVDSGATLGALTIYTVAAITPFGTSQRTRSNEVTPTGGKETVAGGDASPKGLSDLKATVVSPTSVRLSWLPSSGFTSFRINRKVGAGLTPSQLIATLAGSVFSFLDHLPAGSLGGGISYEIEAVDAKGSAQKATVAIAPEKAATDSAGSTPSLKGPTGLKATVVSPTLIRLTWSPGLVGAMYRVMREVLGATQVIATLPGSVSNFLDHFPPGGAPGMIGYWIEAVDGKGASERITVTMDPDKGPDEGEIDSLPRPRGRP